MRKLFIYLKYSFMLLIAANLLIACSDNNDEETQHPPGVNVSKTKNTAVLLCSFGSTYPEPQATYQKIMDDFQKAFPNADIYLSFTSGTIVSRVYAQINKAYAQPDVWMTALGKAGYDSVFVQSLHIIPGEEYLGVRNTITKKYLSIPFPNIQVGRGACLLDSDEDIQRVAKILYDYYKPQLDAGEVVALMGHGNPDKEYIQANNQYTLLEQELQKLSGEKNIFIGTVDWGHQMFAHVREGILDFAKRHNKTNSEVTVTLGPLMSIAGDHAQNDLLGDLEEGQTEVDINPYESDMPTSDSDPSPQFSWKKKLEKLGFKINPKGSTTTEDEFNVVGLGDHSEIRQIWIDHLLSARKEASSMEE